MDVERWGPVSRRLEIILENNAYRFALCMASVILVVGYVAVASRMAEPPKWSESPLVSVEETAAEPEQFDVRAVDALNRAIVRLSKLQSVLKIHPQRLTIRPTQDDVAHPFELETRVLRLWLDEVRGFAYEGMYDVTSEAIARAIIAIVFPTSIEGFNLPSADSNWFAHVRSIRETCDEQPRREWRNLCVALKKNLNKSDAPNPLSLSGWLTSQMINEAQGRSTSARIGYIRDLVKASADRELLKFESAKEWPAAARSYGSVVRTLVTRLAPNRAASMNFKIGLFIVSSCSMPRLGDLAKELEGVDAQDVVWVRVCENSMASLVKLVDATSANEFAIKNPDAAFAQVGVPEIQVALKKGWLDAKTDLAEFVIEGRDPRSRKVATRLRPQREEWDATSQAFRVHAPVEILKLVRLRPI